MTQTRPWLAFLLLSCSTLFADEETTVTAPQKPQAKEITTKNQMMSGYNAPARIEVRGSWDVYAMASFIYWQARQENMEIGIISHNAPDTLLEDTPFSTNYVNNMTVTNPHFTYRPGFKVGLGVNLDWDNWDAYAEYTWFHSSIHSGVNSLSPATTGTAIPPNGEYLYPIQGPPAALNGHFFKSAGQSWDLNMDFIDLSLSRSYYSGRRVTITPFFGARGAWIRQHLNTDYVGAIPEAALGDSTANFHDSSTSWGIGPRTGFESNWLLGCGTRFIGNVSGDILYSRYSLQQDDLVTDLRPLLDAPILSNAAISQTIDYLRAHAAFELGFGWGTYFDNCNWHIDLSATYGFQAFWDQNMFRNFENPAAMKSFTPNGNLYVHGVTVNADFDF